MVARVRFVLLAALLASACADDGGECIAPAGCYEMRMTVGTGTCDAQVVREVLEPLGTYEVAPGAGCGRVVAGEYDVSSGCGIDVRIEVDLTAAGASGGLMAVQGDSCAPDGSACEHAFEVVFDPVDPAACAGP